MKMLSSLGAVEIKRGDGTFVASHMSPEMLNPLVLALAMEQGVSRQWVEMRLVLDTAAAELIVQHNRRVDLSPLVEANQGLLAEIKRGTHGPQRLLELDLAFHERLHELSGNQLLAKIARVVYRLFFASIDRSIRTDPMLAYSNHARVIEAIRRRDLVLIRKRMHASFAHWTRYLDGGLKAKPHRAVRKSRATTRREHRS